MSKMMIQLQENKRIEIELYDSIAPLAISRMQQIASMGKYDHHIIERLEPGFVIQPLFFDGVDEEIDQMVELEALKQDTSVYYFDTYVVGMAGDGKLASGSQFFICMSRQKRLDGLFTIVGRVTKGFSYVDLLDSTTVEARKDPMGYTYHAPKEVLLLNVLLLGRFYYA